VGKRCASYAQVEVWWGGNFTCVVQMERTKTSPKIPGILLPVVVRLSFPTAGAVGAIVFPRNTWKYISSNRSLAHPYLSDVVRYSMRSNVDTLFINQAHLGP
jgi:hypothetical protein